MQQEKIVMSVPTYIRVKDKSVKVKDIVNLAGSNDKLIKRLEEEFFYNFCDERSVQVFSSLMLTAFLENKCTGLEVFNEGETEFILEYKPERKNTRAENVWELIKVALISLAIFTGSAFTIMTFNSDVDVGGVFEKVYELAGIPESKSKVLEISYSIGLFAGITLFFNRFPLSKSKMNPTPLEVQMTVYQDGINKAVVEQSVKDGSVHKS